MGDEIRLDALLTKFEESIKTMQGMDGLTSLAIKLVELVMIEGKYIVEMEKDIIEMREQIAKK